MCRKHWSQHSHTQRQVGNRTTGELEWAKVQNRRSNNPKSQNSKKCKEKKDKKKKKNKGWQNTGKKRGTQLKTDVLAKSQGKNNTGLNKQALINK